MLKKTVALMREENKKEQDVNKRKN